MRQILDNQNDLENARAYPAGDVIHAYEILKNSPGTAKIAIGFEREKARSNFPGGDITGRVDQYLYAIISRGRGVTNLRAANLVYGSDGGSPLFNLAEKMRDKLRSVRFDPLTDEQPDYVSLEEWGTKEIGVTIDAFKCTIWVGTQTSPTGSLAPVNQNNQLPL
jgi:hypothetical protein